MNRFRPNPIIILLLLIPLILASCQPGTDPSPTSSNAPSNSPSNQGESVTPIASDYDIDYMDWTSKSDFSFDKQAAYHEAYEAQTQVPVPEDMDLSHLELTPQLIESLNAEPEASPIPITTYDHILEAYEAGTITEADYALYTVLSGYDDTLLPETYKGQPAYGVNIQFEIQYLVDHWTELSDATRTTIEPYIVPISNPKSIFQQAPTSSSKHFLSTDVYAASVWSIDYSYDSVTYELQYPDDSSTQNQAVKDYYEKRIDYVKQAIQDAYPKYVSLLGNRLSKKVIVEVVPMGNDYGEAWMEADAYRIRLNIYKLTTDKVTKATFVHELFHCMQFELGMKYQQTEIKWAMEATATWSEHYVYSDYNSEHEYLSKFFTTLHKDRIGFGSNFEYGSYMLMYFLTDYWQSDAFVGGYLNAIKGNNSHLARSYFSDTISDFREAYGEFATYSFDRSPMEVYYDHKKLPGYAAGKAMKYIRMGGNDIESKTVKLDAGSLQYYYFSFDDVEDAKHILFKFEDDLSLSEGMRQAAIYANGEWRLEDWSEDLEVQYCRNSLDESEHVDKVILYYSNGDLTLTAPEVMDKFEVKTKPCKDEVQITITGNYTIIGPNNSWQCQSTIDEHCKVIGHNLFAVYKTTFDMSGQYQHEGVTYVTTTANDSAMFSEEPDLMTSNLRLVYPGLLGDEGVYKELANYGISEVIPETGLLFTLVYFEGDTINGSTTMSFPEPVGTTTLDVPLMMNGLVRIGAIVLPEDIRMADNYFEMTIDPQTYVSPISQLWTLDLSAFQSALPDMDMTQMPDLSGMEGLDLPEGFEMPDMGSSGMDLGGLGALSGFMALNGSTGSAYVTQLKVTITVTWLD